MSLINLLPIKMDNISLENKIKILNKAKEICNEYWVDELDCSVSFARRKINMTFDEVMSKFNDKCHFTIIHRKNKLENHIEVCFSTFTSPAYFLWIIVNPDLYKELVNGILPK